MDLNNFKTSNEENKRYLGRSYLIYNTVFSFSQLFI